MISFKAMDGAGVERDNTSSASRLWVEQEFSGIILDQLQGYGWSRS